MSTSTCVDNKPSVDDLLKSLGESSTDVAAKLQAILCYGVRQSAILCPIAQYLRKHGHREVGVSVTRVLCGLAEYKVPEGPERFIREFDNGKWPSLEFWPGSKIPEMNNAVDS